MGNKKCDCSNKGVSKHNNKNLTMDQHKKIEDEKNCKNKVRFHSEFINERLGELDITV